MGSRGASGRILLMGIGRWKRRLRIVWGNFSVVCSLRSVIDNFEWAFAGV